MNRLITNIPKNGFQNNIRASFLSLSQLLSILQTNNNILVVQISKAPTSLFKNSLWIGYRNGGMASWLSTLLPHLPFKQFCLYMNETQYTQSDYMYSYYGEYFQKLFHKSYIGLCIHPRDKINSQNLAILNQVTASQLPQLFINVEQKKKNVLLDLRGYDQTVNNPVNHLIPKQIPTEYVNVPLNDDDIIELLYSKISHISQNIRFITMCAKGYRSLIGYSLMKLIAEPSWEIKLCRNSFPQIKKALNAASFNNQKKKINLLI